MTKGIHVKRKTNIFAVIGMCLFTGVLVYAGLIFAGILPNGAWMHLPIHTTIETAGGISALLIALVLFQQKREFQNGTFFWVGTGIGCMGVIDTFHAMSMPGEAFVFLHSAASLAGGVFFALIYLPENSFLNSVSEKRWISGIAYVLSISVGIRALVFPNDVPTIVTLNQDSFSLAAVFLNSMAGLLFIVTVPGFYYRYRRFGHPDFLVFMALGLSFGLPELIFSYSHTWNALWWAWHLLRFLAYVMTLVFLVNSHVHLSHNGSAQ